LSSDPQVSNHQASQRILVTLASFPITVVAFFAADFMDNHFTVAAFTINYYCITGCCCDMVGAIFNRSLDEVGPRSCNFEVEGLVDYNFLNMEVVGSYREVVVGDLEEDLSMKDADMDHMNYLFEVADLLHTITDGRSPYHIMATSSFNYNNLGGDATTLVAHSYSNYTLSRDRIVHSFIKSLIKINN
jgi:hypothetical protein